MNLDKLLPPVPFAAAELHEIAKAMHVPAVRKYLLDQQAKAIKSIANGLPNDKEGETDAAYLRRQAVVVGQLHVFEVLLSIEKPVEAGEVQS